MVDPLDTEYDPGKYARAPWWGKRGRKQYSAQLSDKPSLEAIDEFMKMFKELSERKAGQW
jgi:hypothetical protein